MFTKRVHRTHRGVPRSGKFAAVLAVMALVGAFAAGSGTAGNSSRSCPVQPTSSQPFLAWGDSNSYFLAPAGDMESSPVAAGWSLTGGASLVAGSESSDVTGSATDSYSLRLANGAAATTPLICVTIHDPELRFFAMNTGDAAAALEVRASFVGNDGKLHTKDLGAVHAGADWSLSQPLKYKDAIQPGPDGTGYVSFTFAPNDATGNWQIYDLYIDPIKSQGSDGWGVGWGGGW